MAEQTKLGMILEGLPPGRDAIHVAIAPVIAGEDLLPGQHVGFLEGRPLDEVYLTHEAPKIGIVDPFLTVKVFRGQRFWVCLYPGRTTSLRHVWTHPAFDPEEGGPNDREFAEAWLRDFAQRADTSYTRLIEVAREVFDDKRRALARGEKHYWVDSDITIRHHTDLPSFMHAEAPMMWKHIAAVTGLPCSEETECLFWCSC